MRKQRLTIFVCYTYKRMCYRNPSMQRFLTMTNAMQRDVIDAMKKREERHAQRSLRKKDQRPKGVQEENTDLTK